MKDDPEIVTWALSEMARHDEFLLSESFKPNKPSFFDELITTLRSGSIPEGMLFIKPRVARFLHQRDLREIFKAIVHGHWDCYRRARLRPDWPQMKLEHRLALLEWHKDKTGIDLAVASYTTKDLARYARTQMLIVPPEKFTDEQWLDLHKRAVISELEQELSSNEERKIVTKAVNDAIHDRRDNKAHNPFDPLASIREALIEGWIWGGFYFLPNKEIAAIMEDDPDIDLCAGGEGTLGRIKTAKSVLGLKQWPENGKT